MGTMLLLTDFGTEWEWSKPTTISYWFVIPHSTAASLFLVTEIVTSSVIAGVTRETPYTSVLHLTIRITLVCPLTPMATDHSIKGSSVSSALRHLRIELHNFLFMYVIFKHEYNILIVSRLVPMVHDNVWATFCGPNNLEQFLAYCAFFVQNMALGHISSTKKKSTVFIENFSVCKFFFLSNIRFLSDILKWQDVKWNMYVVPLGIRVSLNFTHICEQFTTAKF